jgi:hypothetical protein
MTSESDNEGPPPPKVPKIMISDKEQLLQMVAEKDKQIIKMQKQLIEMQKAVPMQDQMDLGNVYEHSPPSYSTDHG